MICIGLHVEHLTMESVNNMDWRLVADAIDHYTAAGFTYIDTPWMVDPAIASITCPDRRYHDMILQNNTVLVASAEQGFLELETHGHLHDKKYVSCGPCWRIRDAKENQDGFHHETFVKVELYVRCESDHEAHRAAQELVNNAKLFLSHDPVVVVTGVSSWDLELNGIEIGSYGARRHHNIIWAYGTGLALPRYREALNAHN